MKKKKILGAVAAIFAAIVCAAPMTACGEFKGEAIALDCFRGAGMTGEYDSSVFYRNDLTVFGGDSDVIWVSKEQDPENGGYFYQYTSGNGGVYTQWNEEDRSYGFSCLRSRDLNDWELCGAVDGGYSARLERADWIKQNLWAPEVIYDDVTGKYYMFFSAMSWTDEAHLAGYKNAYGEGRDYNPNNYHMTVFVADVPQGPFRALTSEEYYTFEGETVQKNEAGETINRNGDVIRSKYPVINIEDHFDLETYAKNTWGEDYKTSSEYNGGVLNAGTMPGIDCSPFIDYDEQGNRKIYLFFSVHWIKGVLAIWGMEMKDWCTPNYETMRMIAPAFLLLTVFVVVPLVMAIYRSFFDYRAYADEQIFVGFQNYLTILRTTSFLNSFKNALLFAVIIVAVQLLISFAFAHVLKRCDNGFGRFVRTVIYVPFLISGIAASIVFLFMTNYGGGLVNGILLQIGWEPIAILMDAKWARILVIVPTLWLGFGYNSLVMYAGLLNIPKDYYEAATLDGAGWWRKLLKITLPGMTNYFLLTIVGLLTGALTMFDIPFLMTGGGPLETTLTPVLYLFNNYRNVLQSSSVTIAGAILVMLIVGTLNAVVFFGVQSKVSDE